MPARLRITAPAALLLGAALGLLAGWGEPAATADVPLQKEESASPSSRVLTVSSRTSSTASTPRLPTEGSAAAYAAAWESLKDGKLPRQERIDLQHLLLREWALVDLAAAIRAVAADPIKHDDDPFDSSAIDYLWQGIAAQPDVAWDIIQSRELGMRTPRLRNGWIQAVGRKDPVELIGKLPQLPQEDRFKAMRAAVVGSHHRDQAGTGGEEVVATLLALRGTADDPIARKALAEGLSSSVRCEDLRADFLRQQDPDVRSIYLDAYAQSFEQLDLPERDAELEALPAHLRAEVVQAKKARNVK